MNSILNIHWHVKFPPLKGNYLWTDLVWSVSTIPYAWLNTILKVFFMYGNTDDMQW